MGRPRKRQCSGETKENTAEFNIGLPEFPELSTLPYSTGTFPLDPYIGVSDLPFTNTSYEQPLVFPEEAPATELFIVDDSRAMFQFGNEFNMPIDFGVDDTNLDDPSLSATSSDSTPHDVSVEKHHHLFAGDKPSPSVPGPPCTCLATMYLAMSSLQEFPTVLETALATVRAAANTAQAAIRCETCGTPAVTDMHAPIETFQNTMLLGTILPIIVNGYKRLLVMVDEEAEIARAAGTKKIFSMKVYGGLARSEDSLCAVARHLEMSVMEPTEWRVAIRGLLRADVYGLEGVTTGLKGIISEVEERQRRRHGQLDDLKAKLLGHETEHRQCLGEKDMLCLRILDTAKYAINSLVIA